MKRFLQQLIITGFITTVLTSSGIFFFQANIFAAEEISTSSPPEAAKEPWEKEAKELLSTCNAKSFYKEKGKEGRLGSFFIIEDEYSYENGKEQFHILVNCIFNTLIEKLETSANEKGSLKCSSKESLGAMLELTRIAFQQEDNPPKGLAFLLMDIYEEYDTFLAEIDNNPQFGIGIKESEEKTGTESIKNHQNSITEIKNDIEEERDITLKAIETTLLAYDEMRNTYPLHKRYECIIEHLQKYRDTMAAIRNYVHCLPSKFIKSATSRE